MSFLLLVLLGAVFSIWIVFESRATANSLISVSEPVVEPHGFVPKMLAYVNGTY